VPTYIKERIPKYLRILHRWCTLKEMNYYYYGGQVREDKMGRIYRTHGRCDNCIEYSVRQPQGGRENLRDLSVYGRTVSKWMLKN
jgi:hypothetical protein